jgi:hypothetical protein
MMGKSRITNANHFRRSAWRFEDRFRFLLFATATTTSCIFIFENARFVVGDHRATKTSLSRLGV